MKLTEQLKNEMTRLYNTGVNLINAMQVEQFPAEMEAHFTNVLKKDFGHFRQNLPKFSDTYQAWYSEAQIVIAKYLPGRLNDFTSLYEIKGRKEIRKDNYVIEDYLRSTVVTGGFDKKVVAGPADAIPLMQQQLSILNAIYIRFESQLAESELLMLGELSDQMLIRASELLKIQFGRSAGVICTVVLEQHLEEVRKNHQLKATKKIMTVNDHNESFYKAGLYDVATYRQLQYLGDIRDLCLKNKKSAPTEEQIADMINGTQKVLKTIF
ncbi:hypothetical protein [Mucilaginibacter sp. SJ]|uniref:hypothetical protein n=1 Tax=Mucilaginibacter sp. SJ TaxID=3029053 RepID=UPI0023A916AF|nr:hypothetical protein [Mucilaginibacter sp. SJ]WEA01783.1 hypothetical protein MusilaSJ_02455 [Mucilaginibacter sp. SJ]